MNQENVKEIISNLLQNIGEDPKREGLLETPRRVSDAYEFLTSGYHKDIEEVMNDALFNEKYDEMVLVKNIDFYSLCEHHMLPFYGKVHVAYIPDGKIIGLSKIPRIVEVFARRLQGTGENDSTDRRYIGAIPSAKRRCSCFRSTSYVYDDARS